MTIKCSTTHAKRSFHRAINAIFWKNRQASIRGGDPWAGKKQMCATFICYLGHRVIFEHTTIVTD